MYLYLILIYNNQFIYNNICHIIHLMFIIILNDQFIVGSRWSSSSKELDQGPAAGNLTHLDQFGPATS